MKPALAFGDRVRVFDRDRAFYSKAPRLGLVSASHGDGLYDVVVFANPQYDAQFPECTVRARVRCYQTETPADSPSIWIVPA